NKAYVIHRCPGDGYGFSRGRECVTFAFAMVFSTATLNGMPLWFGRAPRFSCRPSTVAWTRWGGANRTSCSELQGRSRVKNRRRSMSNELVTNTPLLSARMMTIRATATYTGSDHHET